VVERRNIPHLSCKHARTALWPFRNYETKKLCYMLAYPAGVLPESYRTRRELGWGYTT